jgi:hypothetical protein
MNIRALSKILGHNSIKVTLDSYGTIIDELMLRNVKELKEKLSPKTQQGNETDHNSLSSAEKELINMAKNASKN